MSAFHLGPPYEAKTLSADVQLLIILKTTVGELVAGLSLRAYRLTVMAD